jgi:ureidoglycolate hydrolase
MAHDAVIRSTALAAAGDARFAPFGTCFALAPMPERIPVPLQFEGEPAMGTSTLTIITALSIGSTGSIRRLERHRFSVQAFLPLTSRPVVAIVAPAGGAPSRAEHLSAFVVPVGYGIAYRTGVWHCGLMGLDGDANVASFVRRMDDGSDTEFVDLSFSMRIAESI